MSVIDDLCGTQRVNIKRGLKASRIHAANVSYRKRHCEQSGVLKTADSSVRVTKTADSYQDSRFVNWSY